MITKIVGEQPFQVLTSNFSISPSSEGYTLQISADGTNFSNLFTVGAGVTRLVTGVAANSYYRLSGNQSKVSINWMKTCVTEGGGSGTELQPVADFPLNAVEGTVISYTGSSSASGVYQYDGNEWTEVGGNIDLSAYWTSAQTQSAITAVEDHLFDVEQVTASALTELHDGLLEVSARTVDMSTYWTSAQTEEAIAEAVEGYATSGDMQSAFTLISETQQVAAAGFNQLEERIDELSGSSVDLSAYYTSAQTEDAIDEKTAKYFTKDAPIIILSQDNINAFFGEASDIRLLDVTNGYYNDNQFDINSEISGDFIIDKDNKEFYIENVPAGIYRIGVHANNVEDPTLTFKVWIDEEEIETNTTNDLPYAVDDRAAILSIGFDYRYANWSLDADAERITFKYNEENEEFDIEVNYKPTIEEALTAYTPTSGFSTINGSAITNGGNIVIQGGGADMSAYYTSAQTEDAISAATSGKADAANVSGNTSNRYFPAWNEQGIITGITDDVPVRTGHLGINGRGFTIYSRNSDLGNIYGPQSAGTAGDILVSTGNGAPVWSAVTFPDASNYVTSAQVETQIVEKNYVNSGDVKSQVEAYNYATVSQIPTVPTSNTAFTNDAGYITSAAIADMVTSTYISTIWRGTQADYDDIPTKDPNTFYIIL